MVTTGLTKKYINSKLYIQNTANDALSCQGNFQIPLGSAVLPSLTFIGNTSNGIFSTTGQIAFASGGLTTVRTSSNGFINPNTGYQTSCAYALGNNAGLGLFSAGPNILSFATNNVESGRFDSNQNLILYSTVDTTNLTTASCLQANGGVVITKNCLIGNNITVGGNVNISGAILGGLSAVLSSKNSSFSVASTDLAKIFLISNSITATLLSASLAGSGFKISFKKSDSISNQFQILANTSDSIIGYPYYLLGQQNSTVHLFSDGINKWHILDYYIPNNATIYTKAGSYTYVIPQPITKIYVCVWGAGGGGGNISGDFNAGGGGGGYSEGFLTVSPNQSLSITVGAGGISSTTSGVGAGGGSSISTIVANGGGAWQTTSGAGSPVVGGIGGSASGGLLNYSGGNGSGSDLIVGPFSGGGGGSAGRNGIGGNALTTSGGNSDIYSGSSAGNNGISSSIDVFFRAGGSGGGAGINNSSNAGQAGFPGAGGSGGDRNSSSGSNGSDGAIIIFY
jgi:hypothetical protein